MAGVAATDLVAVATDTGVAATDTGAADMQAAVDMPAEHAATLVVGPAATLVVELAADLAAVVDTQVVDSAAAMQVVAVAMAADTGKF
jgi:hypothetical protein